MGGADNGLTLEGLAQRLEVQGRENAERLNALERENARLRDEVAAFGGSDPGRDGVGGVLRTSSASRTDNRADNGAGQATEVPEGRMDRRRLLKGAAAAAAGLLVAGSLTQRDIREAKADQLFASTDQPYAGAVMAFNDNDLGQGVYGSGGEAGVVGKANISDSRIFPFKAGVHGYGAEHGVYGRGSVGVSGASTGEATNDADNVGVRGSNNSGKGSGVYGFGYNGVEGHGFLDGVGVIGSGDTYNNASVGVKGEGGSTTGVGVKGEGGGIGVSGESTKGIGVRGQATGANVGVLGRNDSADTNSVGVQGENGITGTGVRGISPRVSVSGEGPPPNGGSQAHIGVSGSSTNGLGGFFSGGRAQLRLNPNATTGRPTSGAHQTGELYMSSTCELFICTRTGGVAVQWRKVQTVPA